MLAILEESIIGLFVPSENVRTRVSSESTPEIKEVLSDATAVSMTGGALSSTTELRSAMVCNSIPFPIHFPAFIRKATDNADVPLTVESFVKRVMIVSFAVPVSVLGAAMIPVPVLTLIAVVPPIVNLEASISVMVESVILVEKVILN